MSESLTPPPRRPAPEELRRRIAADLARAEGNGSRRGRVLVPVAAALVLLAGTAGILGATRADGHRDLVPVDRPSPSQTVDTEAPRVSPTPRPTPSDRPETLSGQPMTTAQIRRDTKSCTEPDPQDHHPVPQQGSMRTVYAFVRPLITNSTSPLSQRVLFVRDDVGQFQCLDGQQTSWSSLPAADFEPTAKVPGGEIPNSGGGTSASCPESGGPTVSSDVMLRVDADRVAAARVTLITDGQAVRVVDLPVDGPLLYVGVRGTGALERLAFRVELRDDHGRVLAVQPYGATGTKPANKLSFTLSTCADVERSRDQMKPKPVPRPSSDRAGVATCRKLIEQDGDQPLDAAEAKAEVTISTSTEWGAVLSDGTRQVGCSLYPTKEISAAEPVTSDPATTEKAFSWATNPIPTGGQTFWAAGHLPGASKIIYRIPDGPTTSATISPTGFWMVKAWTDTDFDLDKPVRVTVTRMGRTSTYSIPWTEENMCQQVSHGC